MTLQYELNTDSYQFWRDAANRIINDLHPEYNGMLQVNFNNDAFQSEASWVNAISSSNVRVYEVVASPNDPAAGASWNQVSVTPPSYGDISAMTISWAESITLEKDSFTVLAGSTLGSDSQIIASFSSEGDVPGYIPLKIVGSDTSSNNSYYYQLNHNVTKSVALMSSSASKVTLLLMGSISTCQPDKQG